MSSGPAESFGTLPLAGVIPSYLYDQYNDDADLQAFVDSYNAIAQGYLNWFNDTPLGVYTDANISGPLLDWVGRGLYGISRPVLSNLRTDSRGPLDTVAMNTMAMNTFTTTTTGSTAVATDDIYKRLMTWVLYRGDGKTMSIMWLKKRVARFLYGPNGTDITADLLQDVSVITPSVRRLAGMNSRAVNTFPMNESSAFQEVSLNYSIMVQPSPVASVLALLLSTGLLPLPIQVNISIGTIPSPTAGYLLDNTGNPFILNYSELG
jgi:hypothetical protein